MNATAAGLRAATVAMMARVPAVLRPVVATAGKLMLLVQLFLDGTSY